MFDTHPPNIALVKYMEFINRVVRNPTRLPHFCPAPLADPKEYNIDYNDT